jgi:hypothetical protein
VAVPSPAGFGVVILRVGNLERTSKGIGRAADRGKNEVIPTSARRLNECELWVPSPETETS